MKRIPIKKKIADIVMRFITLKGSSNAKALCIAEDVSLLIANNYRRRKK